MRAIVFLLLLLPAVASAQSSEPTTSFRSGPWPGWTPSPRTQVVLLGTGTPVADPERSGPATAIIVDGTSYIIDAGAGVVRRAALAARAWSLPALDPETLGRVFITHLHSDHTLGLADLIFSPWVLGRTTPLELYGPEGIEEMSEHLIAAYDQDIRMRRDGLEAGTPAGYQVNAYEIEPGVVYQDSLVSIEAFAVTHGSWLRAYGYRVETPDRVIVISGDAAPSENLVEASRGADLLIHEVYANVPFQRGPTEWRAYHSSFHTSTVELAEIAVRARPGLLVLYHQLFFGATPADLLAEIATGYDGAVVSGRDLDIF